MRLTYYERMFFYLIMITDTPQPTPKSIVSPGYSMCIHRNGERVSGWVGASGMGRRFESERAGWRGAERNAVGTKPKPRRLLANRAKFSVHLGNIE